MDLAEADRLDPAPVALGDGPRQAGTPPRPKRLTGRALLRVLAVAGVVAIAVLAARHLDFARVFTTLRSADLLLLATAAPALFLLNLVLRAKRFHVLIEALPAPTGEPCGVFAAGKSLMASIAANNLVPLRLGELVRTRDLVQRGYALPNVAAAQVTEKVVEAVTLVACSLPLLSLGLLQLPRVPPSLLVALGGALVLGLGAFAWKRRLVVAKLGALRRSLVAPRAVVRSLLWSQAADLTELVLIAVCLKSLGIAPSWANSIAVFVGINLAIAIPSTPSQIGAFEAGGAFALTLLGVPADQAVAFALLYRVVQWVPNTVLGGVVLVQQGFHLSWRPDPKAP